MGHRALEKRILQKLLLERRVFHFSKSLAQNSMSSMWVWAPKGFASYSPMPRKDLRALFLLMS
jgi:hypothetical protein